jgi:hypothetical protein
MSSIAVGRARHFEYRLVLLTAGLVALGLGVARADFTPLTLTSGSYNQDVVVEKTATTPVTPGGATTASMDGGINNDGDTWNEQGFFADNPEVGLPAAGSVVITNLNGVSYSFQLAPSYTANNAIMLDSSFFTNTTFTLSTPTAFGKLSVLTSGGMEAVSLE